MIECSGMREQNQVYEKLLLSREDFYGRLERPLKKIQSNEFSASEKEVSHAYVYESLVSTLVADYSLGEDLSAIEDLFDRACEHYLLSGTEASCGTIDSYHDNLALFSLAIIFEVPLEKFERLADVWKNLSTRLFKGGDLLIEKLISFRLPDYALSKELLFPDMYGPLFDVILEESKANAVPMLTQFLTKHWYKSWKKSGSHNYASHREKSNYLFVGYWCFAAAAVVKIKGLELTHEYGEYFPFSLFGLEEVPSKKRNLVLPRKTWKELTYGNPVLFAFKIPGSWIRLRTENYQVKSPGEKVVLNLAVYNSNGHPFRKFVDIAFSSKTRDMPWNRELAHLTKVFIGKGGLEHTHEIKEWEGVWPEETEVTTYLTSCLELGDYFLSFSFVGGKADFAAAKEDIIEILASIQAS